MKQKIEAIKETVKYIQRNWMPKASVWEGTANDFLTLLASLSLEAVYPEDLADMLNALHSGEHVPVEDFLGYLNNHDEVQRIYVRKGQ